KVGRSGAQQHCAEPCCRTGLEPRPPSRRADDRCSRMGSIMNEIVAGVDGSPGSLAAVRWAADRASRGSAGLRLVCAVPRWAEDMPEWGPHAGVGRWARRDADDTLATAARVAREVAPRLDVTT